MILAVIALVGVGGAAVLASNGLPIGGGSSAAAAGASGAPATAAAFASPGTPASPTAPAVTSTGQAIAGSQPAASSSPSPSPSPARPPSPSPLPTSPSAGGAVPGDFQPVSVTYVSPLQGWVMGVAGCGSLECVAIVRTADGGHTWQGTNAPRTPLSGVATGSAATAALAGLEPTGSAASGVSGLRFADSVDGWAYGPDLWATHDGGTTWRRVAIAGAPHARVVALEVSGGYAYAAVIPEGSATTVDIASSPVASDSWRLSQASVPLGTGSDPTSQIVLAGGAGWLLQVDEAVVGGAQLGTGGGWSSWSPPCAQTQGAAVLAAADATHLFAACDVGQWGGVLQGETLYASSDGGASFGQVGGRLPIQAATAIAAANPGSIFVGGVGSMASGSPALLGSFDGGSSWRLLFATDQVPITYLGFTTPTQGVAIAASDAGAAGTAGTSGTGAAGTVTGAAGSVTGTLYMTFDGGRTWAPVTF